LEFVRRLVQAGGKVKIPTTLNSQSTDRRRWEALGVPITYATNANALGDAYVQLGCQPSFTCAPYLLLLQKQPNPSHYLGQDWVWGESNAVVFANSVLGARTDKVADYLDICCAITGIVPKVGAHLDANRQPTIVLDATAILEQISDEPVTALDSLFPTLGYLCGIQSDGRVPLLIGLEPWKDRVTLDHMKAFCAAYGTTGSSPLIHVAGITAEAKNLAVVRGWMESLPKNVVVMTPAMLEKTYQSLDKDQQNTKVDLIALGNPHLSVSECQRLVELVTQSEQGHKHANVRIMACISRAIQQEAQQAGYIQPLMDFGVEFVNDTCWCMLLDPPVIPADKNATILTNSGKYAHYGPGLTQRQFRFGSMADCIRTATLGVLPAALAARPAWLSKLSSSKRGFHTTIFNRQTHLSRMLSDAGRKVRSPTPRAMLFVIPSIFFKAV